MGLAAYSKVERFSEPSDAGISIVLEVFGFVKENCPERDQRSGGWYAVSMPARNSAEILKRWLAAINGHDVSDLTALMSAHHVFVDSLGNRVDGAKSMEAGWRGYFAICPDYWIRGDHAMAEGETMLVAGEAGGTIDGESWRTPAAWKVVIRDGSVVEWQVFADNKPVYEILGRRRP